MLNSTSTVDVCMLARMTQKQAENITF